MRVLSLFSGAGGADLGLEAAGMQVVAMCEIEPHARAVLRHRWPDVPLHDDVTTLDGTQYRGRVDVVVGGSPCQDLSIAGKRAGLAGSRSGLFHAQMRVWQETEAPFGVWENVVGALSSNKGEDFAVILGAFIGCPVAVPRGGWRKAGRVSGPAGVACWRVLDAQFFGVPQRRRRVFVVGARAGIAGARDLSAVCESLLRDPAPGGEAGQGVAADAGRGAAVAFQNTGQRWWNESAVAQTLRTPTGGDANKANVVVASAVGVLGPVSHALTHEGADASEDGTGRGTPVVAVNISDGRASLDPVMGTLGARSGGQEVGAQTRGVVLPIGEATARQSANPGRSSMVIGEPGDPMFTLSSKQHGVFAFAENQRGEVRTSDVALQITTGGGKAGQGYPAVVTVLRNLEGKPGGGKGPLLSEDKSLTLGTSNDQVVFPAGFRMVAFGEYAEDGTASAVKARDFKDATDLVVGNVGIPRRLMPIECERLMGWPDDHTAVGVDEQGRTYALKDTPRYKLCGNGIASPVIEWIGRQMLAALTPATTATTLEDLL